MSASDELVFYTNPMSRGRIVRWMLEEVGQPYRTELLEYDTTMKAPAYLAINPMGKVPAIGHRGIVVTECAAICAYLAAVPVEAAVTAKALGLLAPADKARTAGYGSYEDTVDALEGVVSGSQYLLGDRFSAADVYVGNHVSWGIQFGTLPARAAFAEYAGRLQSRDAYVRAAALDDAEILKRA